VAVQGQIAKSQRLHLGSHELHSRFEEARDAFKKARGCVQGNREYLGSPIRIRLANR